MSSPPPPAVAAPPLPLPHYAAVQAALAEGFALPDVLALEGIAPKAWKRADGLWKAALAQDPAELARYADELALAEDWLGREVKPLCDDLAAWLAFLDAYAAHSKPFELLKSRELGLNDVARLRRAWQRRGDTDPALVTRIAELRKQALPPLPALTLKAPVLKRSRYAAGASSGAVEAAGPATANEPAADAGVGLDRYAALVALRDLRRRGGRAALGLTAPTPEEIQELAALESRFREEFARAPSLERDFRALVAHALRRLRRESVSFRAVAFASSEGASPSYPGPAPAPPSAAPLESRAAPVFARSAALAPAADGALPFSAPARTAPSAPTAQAPDVLPRALPFDRGASASVAEPSRAPGAADFRHQVLLGPPSVPATRPGAPSEPPPPPSHAALPWDRPRSPAAVKRTSMRIRALLQSSDLPPQQKDAPAGMGFALGRSAMLLFDDAPNSPKAAPTTGDDTPKAAPSRPQARAARPPPPPRHAPKRPPATMVLPAMDAAPALPELTVEQYAAFRAERAAFPERLEHVLARYRIPNVEAARLLDAQFRTAILGNPTMEARYAQLYRHYTTFYQQRKEQKK